MPCPGTYGVVLAMPWLKEKRSIQLRVAGREDLAAVHFTLPLILDLVF